MLGILEAIKKGFSTATKSLGLVLIIVIFNLIWNLTTIPLLPAPGAEPPTQLSPTLMILAGLYILVSIFVQGGTLGLIKERIKEGKIKIAGFTSYGLKYYLRLFGLGLLIILIMVVVALVATLIVAATAPLNNAVITGIAVAIAIAIGLAVGVMYFIPLTLSPYALVCEDLGIIAAMKKSLAVARKPFSRTGWLALLFVLLILISMGIGFVVGFLAGLVTALMSQGAGRVLMAIVTSIVNGYVGVVMMASFMIFYLSLSVKEKAQEKIF